MHSIRVAAFRFKLDGHMFDAEFGRDASSDGLQQIAREAVVIAVHLHMCRHHDEARFNGPDVQVMDILHAGNGFDGGRNQRGADTGGSGLQQNFK